MNNMFSKAAIWLVIALVLFTVFKQFDTRQARASDVPYSQFMAEAREGRVDAVVIEGPHAASAQSKDGKSFTSTRPATSGWSAT